MTTGWRVDTVMALQREGILLVEDGNHGENRPLPDEFVSEGVAFIRAADMDAGRVLFDAASRINATATKRIVKGIGRPEDVLLSHKGTVGKVAFVRSDAPAFVCSPQTTFWRALNRQVLDPTYLYAYLRSPGFHEQLRSRAGETDMAPYVSLTSQRSLTVAIPPLPEQRAIARILGALDDKIELNRRTNETLEAMARALFKSWFVDFDPVRAKMEGRAPAGMDAATAALFPEELRGTSLGAVPQGWMVGGFNGHAELLSGGTPKTSVAEFWDGSVLWASAADVSSHNHHFLVATERTITPSGVASSSAKIVPQFTTVVIARGATTGRMCLLGSDMAINQTCYALHTTDDCPFFTYSHLLEHINTLTHAAHGSIFDTITTQTFTNATLCVPPRPLRRAFDASVGSWFKRRLINTHESRTLAALRDALLPRLLSGELRVRDAERLAERAL